MIVGASIFGLLGEFDHTIELEADWQFAIAFGLNGVGKTKFLEVINATINPDYSRLATARFNRLELRSSDGDALDVQRSLFEDDRGPVTRLDFRLTQASGRMTNWSHEVASALDEDFARFLQQNTSFSPIGNGQWEDRFDGDVRDISELRQIFSGSYTPRRQSRVPADRPKEIADFLARNQTYLIETQRLGMVRAQKNQFAHHRSQSSPRWSVDGYSSDLKDRLQRALAENSLRSQRLDRSFPRRLLSQNIHEAPSQEEIQEQFAQLEQLRARLSDIGLTDAEDHLPLLSQQLERWQAAVLSNYIKDNFEKLGTFDDLRMKIDLLEDLLNTRFLRKTVDVSVADGLTVMGSDGKAIPASGLSSGEQHELVLIYNLLFRVAPGTLVLIDEPEISLHVSWQKQFLQDVLRIAQASNLKFIIATHSPSIIGKWWSRTVQLGPGDSENA